MLYVSAHAPHTKRPQVERDRFWDDLLALLLKLVERYRGARYLLIDANGRVGPSPPHVGDHDAELVNSNGAALMALLKACKQAPSRQHSPPRWLYMEGRCGHNRSH